MEDARLANVRSNRDYYARYHNHKELMAYGGAVLYLTGAVSILLANEQQLVTEQQPPLLPAIILTAVLGLVFVTWQLRNRRIAALVVEAYNRLLTGSLNNNNIKEWKIDPRIVWGQSLPHFVMDECIAVSESRRGFRSSFVSDALTYLILGVWTFAALWKLFH